MHRPNMRASQSLGPSTCTPPLPELRAKQPRGEGTRGTIQASMIPALSSGDAAPELLDLPPPILFLIMASLSDRDAAIFGTLSRATRKIAEEELRYHRVPRLLDERISSITNESAEDLQEISRSMKYDYHLQHERSMSTGRSLLLDRFLMIPDRLDRFFSLDSYTTVLALKNADLEALGGKKILDVGSGVSIFSSEAAVVYGITVDRVDLNVDKFKSIDYYNVRRMYVEQMAILLFMNKNFQSQLNWYLGNNESPVILDKLQGKIGEIVLHFENSRHENPIRALDITKRSNYKTDAYDGVFCCWVLMYFDTKAEQAAALREMVRITKLGGLIRIFPAIR